MGDGKSSDWHKDYPASKRGVFFVLWILLVFLLAGAEESGLPLLSSWHDHRFIFNPGEQEPWPIHAGETIFDTVGRNPGSAAHPNAPGRVRTDAPAVHELAVPYARDERGQLTGKQPVPPVPPDPHFHETVRLSDDSRFDDFPVVASNPLNRNEVWVAWTSYAGRQDQIRLSRRDNESGRWSAWNAVPGVSGDVWRPSLAFLGNKVWVIWAQRVLPTSNFDLFARCFDGQAWGPLHRLTDNPGGDFDQTVTVDAQGRLHVAWQSFRQGQADILHCYYDGVRWSPEQVLSESGANDWSPGIAGDSHGRVWVAWDTYDKGNYDVSLRPIEEGRPGPVRKVAASGALEARPSLAIDRQDRVWVAFEEGEFGWGKDQGLLVDEKRAPGSMLNLQRQVRVRIMEDPPREARPPLPSLFPRRRWKIFVPTDEPHLSHPSLWCDARGQMHLTLRKLERPENGSEYWRPYVTTMTPQGWSQPVPLPYSIGRLSMFVSATPAAESGLWISWTRDQFPTFRSAVIPPPESMVENVYVSLYKPDTTPGVLIGDVLKPAFPSRPAGHPAEDRDVRRIRNWRVVVGGRELRILRGDTHRHTEFSLDLRGVPDGSPLDFYRYMLDAASMDFGLITDHQYGAEREYWWWLEEKLADMFLVPEGYTSLFGYERSVGFPFGHRNVVRSSRGIPPLPFFQPVSDPFRRQNAVWSNVRPEDTKLLYEHMRETGGIVIPHTTATNMGTDWRDHDPDVETVVEIFQGDRHSYEVEGAPLTDQKDVWEPEDPPAKRTEGYLSRAWEKGYRLGVVASSDHVSTHISYAMVWAEDQSREAILEAMKGRRTYAATDNIVLEFWLGEHFMGEELTSAKTPPLHVKAIGTRPLSVVEILRNSKVLYRQRTDSADVDLTYEDLDEEPGPRYYYVRVQQEDGQMAWSSPIWLELQP